MVIYSLDVLWDADLYHSRLFWIDIPRMWQTNPAAFTQVAKSVLAPIAESNISQMSFRSRILHLNHLIC